MRRLTITLGIAALVGCGKDGTTTKPADRKDAGGMDAAVVVNNNPSYKKEEIKGCGAAGYQTAIAVGGGKIGVATLATTDQKADCMSMNGTVQVQSFGICYAQASGGGTFTTSTVSTESYLAMMGVGLAMNSAGDATVAYTGGMPAKLRCGAGDMMLASGAGFGTKRTAATDSASGGLVAGQEADCVQNVCGTGDAVGFWPALAFDKNGKLGMAFRDLHFGFAADDIENSSDVEFARDGGATLTVDVSHGGGVYLRLGFLPDGKAVVAHYNGKATMKGIWVNREMNGNTWEAKRVATAKIGEQIGFGISATGRIGIAYYDEDRARLVYLESEDGSTWAAAKDVDTDGITGQFPSLAFDAAGEPAIAYYRCADYSPTDRSCKTAKDGLQMARRVAGKWKFHTVSADSGIFDGQYPALAFVEGKAIIAYQTRFYDPAAQKSDVSLMVAREE